MFSGSVLIWIVGVRAVPQDWVARALAVDEQVVHAGGSTVDLALLDAFAPFSEPQVTVFGDWSQNHTTGVDFLASLNEEGVSAVLRIELLDNIRAFEPMLGDAVDDVERGAWTAHIYASPPGMSALKNHSDVKDIAVFQLAGQKNWLRCASDKIKSKPIRAKLGQCRTYDVNEMNIILEEAGTFNDCFVDSLRPGDIIKVPRGMVHSATASDLPSLHLTVAVDNQRRRLTDFENGCTAAGFTDSCYCAESANATFQCGREEDAGTGAACPPGTFSQTGFYTGAGFCDAGCDSSCDGSCDGVGGSNCDSSCDDSCDDRCDACTGCLACPTGRFSDVEGSTGCADCPWQGVACSAECPDEPSSSPTLGPTPKPTPKPSASPVAGTFAPSPIALPVAPTATTNDDSSSKKSKKSGQSTGASILIIVISILALLVLCAGIAAAVYRFKYKEASSYTSTPSMAFAFSPEVELGKATLVRD